MNTLTEEDRRLLANIGQLYAGLRQEAGLTQRQAAALADSTQARVSYLELGGRDILITTLARWANVYGYSLEIHLEKKPSAEALDFNDMLETAMSELEQEKQDGGLHHPGLPQGPGEGDAVHEGKRAEAARTPVCEEGRGYAWPRG